MESPHSGTSDTPDDLGPNSSVYAPARMAYKGAMQRRRHVSDIEGSRLALSLRGIERTYGFSREFVAERVRAGEIPATPRGRALVVLCRDFECWMRANAVRAASHAESVVARVLEREAAAGAPNP